jgi:hypothetical protein
MTLLFAAPHESAFSTKLRTLHVAALESSYPTQLRKYILM